MTRPPAERAGVSVGSLYQYFPNKALRAGSIADVQVPYQWARLSVRNERRG
ncbi:TetR family transcriptional regulator [Aminobacter aminovorans]|uniref:TetR family transcriptional regulator n=1 Tax=Aminobacter aminovorans TaxID=83263 RepID=UPI000E1FE24B